MPRPPCSSTWWRLAGTPENDVVPLDAVEAPCPRLAISRICVRAASDDTVDARLAAMPWLMAREGITSAVPECWLARVVHPRT